MGFGKRSVIVGVGSTGMHLIALNGANEANDLGSPISRGGNRFRRDLHVTLEVYVCVCMRTSVIEGVNKRCLYKRLAMFCMKTALITCWMLKKNGPGIHRGGKVWRLCIWEMFNKFGTG